MAVKVEEGIREDLEAAMHRLIHEHSLCNATIHEHLDQSRKQALSVAVKVSNLLVDSVNGDVQEAFTNEKQIEAEARSVAFTVQKLVKQTNQWITMFRSLDSALKEIGDFENWMSVMERDCEVIASTLGSISSSKV